MYVIKNKYPYWYYFEIAYIMSVKSATAIITMVIE